MRVDLLREVGWFEALPPLVKAQLALDIEVVELKPGDKLFSTGDPIDSVHYVIHGCFSRFADGGLDLDEEGRRQLARDSLRAEGQQIQQGFLGHEVALDSDRLHHFCLVAEQPCQVLKIEIGAFSALLTDDHDFRKRVYRSVIFADPEILSPVVAKPKRSGFSWSEDSWWLLAIVSPLVLYVGLTAAGVGIGRDQILFASLLLGSLVLWIGEIVPILAPSLVILVGLSLLEIAPIEVVLSGFGNSSFLFMIALFVIGGLIKSSGLAFRFCLMILEKAPPKQNWVAGIMFLMGFVLNPILPSASSRSNILAPLLIDMKKNLKLADRSPMYTLMTVSLFAGISTFSFVFISAKSDNLILFALLPDQVRDAFGYGNWLFHSLALAVPLLVLSALALAFSFRKVIPFDISKETIKGQLNLLGPLSTCEVSSIASVLIFLIGTATSALHGLSMVWVSMVIFCYLLLTGVVSGSGIKSMVDWPFLLFLASLIGLSSAIPYSDFDEILFSSLQGFGSLIQVNIYLFTIVFAGIVYGLRLFLPGKLCGPLVATVFIPLFVRENVNPWILCMMCLVFTDAAFFPYQHPPLSGFLSVTQAKDLLDGKSFFRINWVINAFRIIAVLIALPVWRLSGIG